ncbi:MAG: class I SAM-dependent methyltransferase [Candidatus Omnitrophota bacterium]
MKCPKCNRFSYFMQSHTPASGALCESCHHVGPLQLPSYEGYHDRHYSARGQKTPIRDPQMFSIFKAVEIKKTDRIVDLGCGIGDYVAALSKITPDVTGYDLDIRAAQTKYPALFFNQHNFTKNTPIASNTIDKLFAINAIEHLEDSQAFLKECHRILKPGGTAVFSTCDKKNFLHEKIDDPTHLHEWDLRSFEVFIREQFEILALKNSGSMFHYFPFNWALCFFIKPDITCIARKALR